jgi:hypothetical protein
LIEKKKLIEINFQDENKVNIGIDVFNLLKFGKSTKEIKFVEMPKSIKDSDWKKYTCKICFGKELNGNTEYQSHLKSRTHRSNLKKSRKFDK